MELNGRQRRWRRGTLAALVVVLHGGTPAAAYEEIRNWPEWLDPVRFPGFQGILENRGDHVHNIGNVLLNVTNFGIIGSMPGAHQSFESAASAQWPAGSGTEYLWGAGLWVGAESFGDISVSAWEVRDERLILEYLPGLSGFDRIYSAREGDAGGARAPAPQADDDGDGVVDEDRLDGRDNDGDGRIDEDFAAVSDQMFTCEYRDDDPRLQIQSLEHRPLGIRVQQTTMAWGEPQVDDIIAFDFAIINAGSAPLFDVYPGFYADFDIGSRDRSAAGIDDMAGFWDGSREITTGDRTRSVPLSIGYMFDADGDETHAEGYVGLMFLGGVARSEANWSPQPSVTYRRRFEAPVHNFQVFTRFSNPRFGGEPTNDAERYAILAGTAPNALPPADRTYVTANTGDYRVVLSTRLFGPLVPGDTVNVRMAMVFGDGFEEMVENAAQAKRIYEGFWFDCDRDTTTGVGGREFSVCGPRYGNYKILDRPCDPECLLDPDCTVKVPNDGCIWIDEDCDSTSGSHGRECHVPWLSKSPPPPPHLRVVPREDRVDLFWDNWSEKNPDPFLQVIDFESYQIWRADNWTRPLGTSPRTGPGTDRWFLMAEYDMAGNGVGKDTSLRDLLYRPRIPEAAIEFYREWLAAHPELPPPALPGLTPAQIDTCLAMARGVRYYHFTDPPFVPHGRMGGPCPRDGACPALETPEGAVPMRCNGVGRCAESMNAPHPGSYVFYAVTASDHDLEPMPDGTLRLTGAGVSGSPNSNFELVVPPSRTGAATGAPRGAEIYVVPNPATPRTLADWALQPNNDDPSGLKVEFRRLPAGRGKISVFTLAADLVVEIPFDGSAGNGSAAWNLISRNGQPVTSGVFLFVVDADAPGFEKFVGRFVVIR